MFVVRNYANLAIMMNTSRFLRQFSIKYLDILYTVRACAAGLCGVLQDEPRYVYVYTVNPLGVAI